MNVNMSRTLIRYATLFTLCFVAAAPTFSKPKRYAHTMRTNNLSALQEEVNRACKEVFSYVRHGKKEYTVLWKHLSLKIQSGLRKSSA
jgi:hypothetical protein